VGLEWRQPARAERDDTNEGDGAMLMNAWYALQVKAQSERSVAFHLEQRGYEQFLPMYRARRRWSDRVKEIEQPLFPSYVFCRVRPDAPAPIVSTPGVIRIVGAANTPIPLDDAEIQRLQLLAATQAAVPWPLVAVGDRVRICEGPLEGLEGTVCREGSANRLIVSVMLLQRAVAVTIDRWRVERVAH
jgi:transcription antitermination factor NusG